MPIDLQGTSGYMGGKPNVETIMGTPFIIVNFRGLEAAQIPLSCYNKYLLIHQQERGGEVVLVRVNKVSRPHQTGRLIVKQLRRVQAQIPLDQH